MGVIDVVDYNRLEVVYQGYATFNFDGTSAGELTSATITHNLGYTPAVVATHLGGGANALSNKQDPTLSMYPVPYQSVRYSGGSVITKYHIWYVVSPTTLTFYRLQGSDVAGVGGNAELVKYYLLSQHGTPR